MKNRLDEWVRVVGSIGDKKVVGSRGYDQAVED